MSFFNSVMGSLSPTFRRSFEDPNAPDHELPIYHSQPIPRIPPPITSTVLWNRPKLVQSSARVPDEILALQRKAKDLEQQLQELLDAQAVGLIEPEKETTHHGSTSAGTTTSTASSLRDHGFESRKPPRRLSKKQHVNLDAARRGIYTRIRELAKTKADETELLNEDLGELRAIMGRTEYWTQKRSQLQERIRDVPAEGQNERTRKLHDEASQLEHEIRMKEEELRVLRNRHGRVMDALEDYENSVEAELSSYKSSLLDLDKEVTHFLERPPTPKYRSTYDTLFFTLPAKRRTLELAHDFWKDERTQVQKRYDKAKFELEALEEGAVVWKNVVKRVSDYEKTLKEHLDRDIPDHSQMTTDIEALIAYLEEAYQNATSRNWNLLICAIGAELGAFKRGKEILETAMEKNSNGKPKEEPTQPDLYEDKGDTRYESHSHAESDDESAASPPFRRTARSPLKTSLAPQPRFLDSDHDDDPDPELLISH
ncbi:hypothetical protein M011DRAFT_482728 [Sporormia fimetaria CBS 119925]|uniref:Uncharacterized protein n=1 Tax=Sporormia fimetaria CBS 119925 TaxID=1340428 RepID=A0A6A6VQ60_9PLEO|nr:hypothetical protein M011DRAFT_482728 [Sporormia fimetaria CBS 119925]